MNKTNKSLLKKALQKSVQREFNDVPDESNIVWHSSKGFDRSMDALIHGNEGGKKWYSLSSMPIRRVIVAAIVILMVFTVIKTFFSKVDASVEQGAKAWVEECNGDLLLYKRFDSFDDAYNNCASGIKGMYEVGYAPKGYELTLLHRSPMECYYKWSNKEIGHNIYFEAYIPHTAEISSVMEEGAIVNYVTINDMNIILIGTQEYGYAACWTVGKYFLMISADPYMDYSEFEKMVNSIEVRPVEQPMRK